jgi:hypothetical protein
LDAVLNPTEPSAAMVAELFMSDGMPVTPCGSKCPQNMRRSMYPRLDSRWS